MGRKHTSSVRCVIPLCFLHLTGWTVDALTGRIPSPYGRMPVLSTLSLDCNRLSGPVPRTLLATRGLGMLNLSRNALEGEGRGSSRESGGGGGKGRIESLNFFFFLL